MAVPRRSDQEFIFEREAAEGYRGGGWKLSKVIQVSLSDIKAVSPTGTGGGQPRWGF